MTRVPEVLNVVIRDHHRVDAREVPIKAYWLAQCEHFLLNDRFGHTARQEAKENSCYGHSIVVE